MLPKYARDQTAGLLRCAFFGSHPFDSKRRLATMLYAYGDLSGSKRRKVYVVAGYVGHETRWAALDKRWAKALSKAKVDHFHATDFFADPPQGAFKGWKRESKRWLEAEDAFTGAAVSIDMIGLARAIHTAGFPVMQTELAKVRAKQKIRSLRLFAAQMFLERIALLNIKKPAAKTERISAYFEEEQGIGEVGAYYLFSKKRRAAWASKFITVAPLPKDVRPLQAADLLAHSVWQRCEYGIESLRPRQRLVLDSGNVEVLVMDEEDCAVSATMIPEFLEHNPTGLILPPRKRDQ